MFAIKIKTDNAAFDGALPPEVARILRDLAQQIADSDGDAEDDQEGYLYDSNGNRVGTWALNGR